MCVMALGMIGGLMGGVVSAMGAKAQADGQAKAAEYQAQVEKNNATAAAYRGTYAAEIKAEEGEKKLGQQQVAFAKSGVTFSGTPMTVFAESSKQVGMDVGAAQYTGRIESQRHKDQAELYKLQAQNAREAGSIAAMSAIIGGFSGIGKGLGGGFGSSLSMFG